jgi:putative tryptophan/tyrosine transport system substrate-binding protein
MLQRCDSGDGSKADILQLIARKLAAKALDGDLGAIKEIFDRMEASRSRAPFRKNRRDGWCSNGKIRHNLVNSISCVRHGRGEQMQFDRLRRRDVITLAAGAAAWPLAARAQAPGAPVIGFLGFTSPDAFAGEVGEFRRGLREAGYVEGENVAIEYRWAENKIERLSVLAGGLVSRPVAVIVAIGGATPAFAAKAETSTIPIVFTVAQDPVKLGLVPSLAKPGGNMTGVFLPPEATARRLGFLRELVPAAKRIAVLLDPANATNAAATLSEVEAAARATGLQIQVLNASTSREIDAASASLGRERPDALFVGSFATDRRVQLALLAMLHRIPASYPLRAFVDAGGLMSYGPSLRDAYRQAGIYVGRILKGAKPADLPVVQSSKYELVINDATARMLGLTVPRSLIATADEVIE